MKIEAFLLAFEIERFDILRERRSGAQPKVSSLPLHCTLLGWVKHLRVAQHVFVAELGELLEGSAAPIAVSDRPDMFGQYNNRPVHVLVPNPELKAMHIRVLELAEALGGVLYYTEWSGEAYTPHVTDRGPKRRFLPGSRMELSRLGVFCGAATELAPPVMRSLYATIELRCQ